MEPRLKVTRHRASTTQACTG